MNKNLVYVINTGIVCSILVSNWGAFLISDKYGNKLPSCKSCRHIRDLSISSKYKVSLEKLDSDSRITRKKAVNKITDIIRQEKVSNNSKNVLIYRLLDELNGKDLYVKRKALYFFSDNSNFLKTESESLRKDITDKIIDFYIKDQYRKSIEEEVTRNSVSLVFDILPTLSNKSLSNLPVKKFLTKTMETIFLHPELYSSNFSSSFTQIFKDLNQEDKRNIISSQVSKLMELRLEGTKDTFFDSVSYEYKSRIKNRLYLLSRIIPKVKSQKLRTKISLQILKFFSESYIENFDYKKVFENLIISLKEPYQNIVLLEGINNYSKIKDYSKVE